MSQLTDVERNFLCLIISEIVDQLNDTDEMVALEKLGLILRAAAACAIQERYRSIENSLKMSLKMSNKSTLGKLSLKIDALVRPIIMQILQSKSLKSGRGSFVEPAALEGDVTVKD